MVFHMLRRASATTASGSGRRASTARSAGRQASFADVRRTMEAVLAKQDAGPAVLRSTSSGRERRRCVEAGHGRALAAGGGFEVRGTLRQTQAGEPFALDVPIVVQTDGAPVLRERAPGERLDAVFAIPFRRAAARAPRRPVVRRLPAARPARDAAVDRADLRRAAPAGGRRRGRPGRRTAAWRALVLAGAATATCSRSRPTPRSQELPTDRAVWLLGRGNALAARLFAPAATTGSTARRSASTASDAARRPRDASSVERHPASAEQAIGWIFVDPVARRCPASAASSRTTASTATSASRATSRRTSSRGSGRRRLAAARRPAVRGRSSGGCGRAGAPAAPGARRAATRLLAEGPPRARGLALGARTRGAGSRHERPRGRGRSRRRSERRPGSSPRATGAGTSSDVHARHAARGGAGPAPST